MHSSDQPSTTAARRRRRSLRPHVARTPAVLAATGLLVICGAPFAAAGTGDDLREGVRNGTTVSETEIIGNLRSTTAQKGGYVTRQSNLSASGGGAIYGCRSKAGGSLAKPLPQNPCLRANNLSSGYAFEFNSAQGAVGGLITVGAGGAKKRPFTTNATGVATGLNADRVDGLNASQILATAVPKSDLLWALVDADAAGASIVRGRGATGAALAGIGKYAVTFNRDISKCAVTATLADASGAAGSAGPIGGEISADQPAAERVAINTLSSLGAPTPMVGDDGFYIRVDC